MTDEEVALLASKAEGATPGPWHNPEGYRLYAGDVGIGSMYECYSYKQKEEIDSDQARANIDYVVAANPNAIKELIDDLRHAQGERDYLAKKLADMFESLDMLFRFSTVEYWKERAFMAYEMSLPCEEQEGGDE